MGAGLGPRVCPRAGKRWSDLQNQVQQMCKPGRGYWAVSNVHFRK